MAEETKCLILQLRPKFQELRDARTYTEVQVKKILFAFARDLGNKWPDEQLRSTIDGIFNAV